MTTRLPILTLDEPVASALLRLAKGRRRIKSVVVADHARTGRVVIRASNRTHRLDESGVWPFSDLGRLDVSQHLGCLLGVVTVARCELIGPGYAGGVSVLDAALDDFRPGRWAWTTVDPLVFPRPLAWPSDKGGIVAIRTEWIEAAQPVIAGRGTDHRALGRVFGVGFEAMADSYGGAE